MIKKIKKLINKLSWSFIGNISYALSQWILITILARLGSLEDLGVYSLALAINAPIILFFSFQLRVMLATEKKDDNKTIFQSYFASRISHLIISLFVVLVISVTYISYVEDSFYTLKIILIVALFKVFEALSDICLGYLQRESQLNIIGKSQFLRSVTSTLVFSILFICTQHLFISLIGLVVVMGLRFYKYDLQHVRKLTEIKPKFSREILLITKIGLPLGFVSLINSLNTNIPKYLLDFYSGVNSVGIYSALAYVLVVGNLVIAPISLLTAPKMTSLFNKDIKKFIKLIIKLCILSLVVFVFIFFVIFWQGDLILNLLYGPDFLAYYDVLVIITIALLFSFITTFINLALIVTRTIKLQPIINLITTIVAISCGIPLIGQMEIIGAAITLLITRLTQTILSVSVLFYAVRKNIKE